MTEGEYLTRITHETFVNYRCAAAGVEFETNKGRIFSYQPLGMSTNWKRLVMSILIRYPQLSCILIFLIFIVRSIHNFSELVTINAMPKKEIIGLKIKHGTLIGSEQQDAIHSQNKDSPFVEGCKHWYCIVTRYPKEESKNLTENMAMSPISRNHINDDSIRFSSFDQITEATTKWKKI